MRPSLGTAARRRALSLAPFGYLAVTRLTGPRDAAYLVASAWVPAIWLGWRLGGEPMAFAPGYLAFIAIYEIGYLVNDAWDAPRTDDGRRRIDWPTPPWYLAAFVGVRLAVWGGIGAATGWIAQPVWLGAYAALVAVFALHNWVQPVHLRLATFAQLACLRFVLPVLGVLPPTALPLVLLIAAAFYAQFRVWSYLDGKGALVLPARRRADFGLTHFALMLPLVGWVTLATGQTVALELAGYFLALHAAYAWVRRG